MVTLISIVLILHWLSVWKLLEPYYWLVIVYCFSYKLLFFFISFSNTNNFFWLFTINVNFIYFNLNIDLEMLLVKEEIKRFRKNYLDILSNHNNLLAIMTPTMFVVYSYSQGSMAMNLIFIIYFIELTYSLYW